MFDFHVVCLVVLSVVTGMLAPNMYAVDFELSSQSYVGIIEPRQLIKVGSPVLGIVSNIPVERGDRVKKGVLVAQLESDIEKLEIELAETRYEMAKKRYDRQAFLQQKKLGTNEDFDQSNMEMELARLEVERRKLILKQKYIDSPVTGVVTEKLVSRGEYIYEQTPIVVVAQTDPLSVEVLLPLSEYGRVQKGMKAQIIPQAPIEGNYTAEVEIIDKVMNAASSTFGIRLRLSNTDQNIPSGIKCTVRFVNAPLAQKSNNQPDALLVNRDLAQ
jgi:membrane fusion protein (multidrug efflux system)